jgi:hypothetical protein
MMAPSPNSSRGLSPVILVLGGLAFAAAGIGWITGLRWAEVDESDVIEIWAERYVAETGGPATDCAAAPGQRDAVWLVVSCGSGPERKVYPLDRSGRLIERSGGSPSI